MKYLINVFIMALLVITVGCAPPSGGGGEDEEAATPAVAFEITGHQLYLVDHQCLADCGYGAEMECIIDNCLSVIDSDQLCLGDIVLLEAFGHNENQNTTQRFFAVDFESGLWDGGYGGDVDITDQDFSVFMSQAYYIDDIRAYSMQIWMVDADGNKTKSYNIPIEFFMGGICLK